ncbi:hypothetical protein [Spirosoma gilvum]
MKHATYYGLMALTSSWLLMNCQRPQAYFQPSQRDNVAQSLNRFSLAETTALQNTPSAPADELPQDPIDQSSPALASRSYTPAEVSKTPFVNRYRRSPASTQTRPPLASSTQLQAASVLTSSSTSSEVRRPHRKKSLSRMVRLGLIIGGVGLLLWIVGIPVIGYLGLLAGLVLVLVGLING